MADLSPAAQAVLDAYFGTLSKTPQQSLAAALRAAVEQVLPEDPRPTPRSVEPGGTRMYYCDRMGRWEERQGARQELLAIAAELAGRGNEH